jgi:hypothetical protein
MIITRIPTPTIAIGRIPASEKDEVACVSRLVRVVFHAAGSPSPCVVLLIAPTTIAVMYNAIMTAARVIPLLKTSG